MDGGGGMRQGRLFAGILLGLSAGVLITGCWTGGIHKVPGNESLATDLTAESTPRVARLQQVEAPDPKFRPQLTPPPLPHVPGGAKQVSLVPSAKNIRVSVRAWVNGKPIFDEEVMQGMPGSAMRELSSLPEPQRSERLAEIYNQTLETILEQEVAYQDAVRKLEKMNPRALEKLKKVAADDFERQMRKIREGARASEEQIKEFEHTLRRQMERSLISQEYVRSRIFPIANSRIGHQEIKDYYDTHRNEFQRLDSVQWQDVFIAVGPKYPTVAHAKRFAEDLILQCRTAEDFVKLIQFDDGDSKFRNGEGMGTRRGEIKPVEVEDILFQLKEGQIGPVIELSTGVHIVRVLKREVAGQIPLDDKTQNMIRSKLRTQIAEREYKRILRELKSRATIEVERDTQ